MPQNLDTFHSEATYIALGGILLSDKVIMQMIKRIGKCATAINLKEVNNWNICGNSTNDNHMPFAVCNFLSNKTKCNGNKYPKLI